MYITTRRSIKAQSLHDTMVRIRANNLTNDGYYVYADISGFPEPPKFGGHIPDIYAVKGVSKIITEIETCETICLDHTREQYTAFSHVSETEFHVKVPESCLSEAKDCAARWGITVNRWWYQEGY